MKNMVALIGFIILLLVQGAGVVLSAWLIAWLFTLVLPVPLNQIMWLSLGLFLAIRYIIQMITDIPGVKEFNFIEIVLSGLLTFFLLAFSGLFGWLLVRMTAVDLTLFEATLLFTVSLTAGLFFIARSGTGGLPVWMTLADPLDEYTEDEYVISPPKRPRRRNRAGRRSTN
jgi:hypothetical protein